MKIRILTIPEIEKLSRLEMRKCDCGAFLFDIGEDEYHIRTSTPFGKVFDVLECNGEVRVGHIEIRHEDETFYVPKVITVPYHPTFVEIDE